MEPAGGKADVRTAAIRAFQQAREAGDAGRMAEAALSLPSGQQFGEHPGQIPALIHEAWRDRLAGPPGGAIREAPVTMHFHQNDAGWLIGRDGATAVLPDVKGLHYIRYLLQRPEQDVEAADLAAAAAGHPGVTVSYGDGDLIDAQALSAYRARLAEIDAELGEAESWADGGRVGRLRLEREALHDEIGAATGLGGRRRQFGSAHERARIAVRKAIVSALDRIEQHDSSLARQLRDSVRTGGACRYHPDPARPVVWILERT